MLDFERERTSVINALVEHTVSGMGYTAEELTEVLHLHYDELATLYQLEESVGLRVVK